MTTTLKHKVGNLDGHAAAMTDAAPADAPSLRPVGEAVASEGAKAAALARHWWAQGATGCQDAVDTVKREAQVLNDRTQAYVRDEPVKSLLIAAGVGAAVTGIAMMLMRRR